ncbi:MAG: Wadjet anti-phage system protein JetD domain-containing protein [Desulfurivibrionaceae bacterium]
MSWTMPADLRTQVQRLWDKGTLLAELAGTPSLFPKRMNLKGPSATELAERFPEARDWIARLAREAKHYRVVCRNVNHRVLGANFVPTEIWIDTLEDALGLIGRGRDAARFTDLVALTGEHQPCLIPWLAQRPLRALELADGWLRLLEIVAWLRQHPRPDVYLRQVDIPGVHSKFIEAHRGVLTELFDLALPQEAVEETVHGLSGFCRRYGFRDKPSRLRFRILEPDLALLSTGTDQDIAVTHDTFARLDLPAEMIFITENEINFLAFPLIPRSMVIFGAGYGFEMLAEAAWLQGRRIYYWGDIDTHGFAILDQLRALFPTAISFLMDRDTLLAHRLHWGNELLPEKKDLQRLNSEEYALYDDLRRNRLRDQLRLEQERIGFAWVARALDKLQQNG